MVATGGAAPKSSPVGSSGLVGVGGVGDVHAGAHDVLEPRPETPQRLGHDLPAAEHLAVRVLGDGFTGSRDRRRPGDLDAAAAPQRAAETVALLVGGAGADALGGGFVGRSVIGRDSASSAIRSAPPRRLLALQPAGDAGEPAEALHLVTARQPRWHTP